MWGILSDKVSKTNSTFLHPHSRRQREWCQLWSFEQCPLYSFFTFVSENVDMIGSFGWILTTNANIKKFSMSPSLLLSESLYALPFSLSDYSSCECDCLGPSPHSALSISELLEAKGCVTQHHASQSPQEAQCLAQSKCSANVGYSYEEVFVEWILDGILSR